MTERSRKNFLRQINVDPQLHMNPTDTNGMNHPRKNIDILGSTGSISTQALEVIAAQKDQFQVEVLTAQRNADLLIAQASQFMPNAVVIGEESLAPRVKAALEPLQIKVYSGENAIASIVEMETIDLVLTALVGYSGLRPTLRAIESGKTVALANKETL